MNLELSNSELAMVLDSVLSYKYRLFEKLQGLGMCQANEALSVEYDKACAKHAQAVSLAKRLLKL